MMDTENCKIGTHSCAFRFSLSNSLAEFAPVGAKKVRIIFGGGVYVAENTLRHASVEFLCQRRKNYARSMAQAFSNANPAQRFAFERVKNTFFDTLNGTHSCAFRFVMCCAVCDIP